MRSGIARLYKAMWYTQVGRALKQRDQLTDNDVVANENDDDIINNDNSIKHFEQPESLMDYPEAVRGAYEDIIRDKQGNIQRYKEAMGQLLVLVHQKKGSLKGLTEDIDKLEEMKKGAIDRSEKVATELRETGIADKDIEQHPKYKRCITSYNDFQSTIEEKNEHIDKLQQEIDHVHNDLEEHKNSIAILHRDLEMVKTEQSEAVADFISAREQEEMNNILSGINIEDVSVELERIREIREKALQRS